MLDPAVGKKRQGTNAGDDIASGNHRDDEGDGKIESSEGLRGRMTPDDRFASPRYLPAQGTDRRPTNPTSCTK